jgi:hypothetical protein
VGQVLVLDWELYHQDDEYDRFLNESLGWMD